MVCKDLAGSYLVDLRARMTTGNVAPANAYSAFGSGVAYGIRRGVRSLSVMTMPLTS